MIGERYAKHPTILHLENTTNSGTSGYSVSETDVDFVAGKFGLCADLGNEGFLESSSPICPLAGDGGAVMTWGNHSVSAWVKRNTGGNVVIAASCRYKAGTGNGFCFVSVSTQGKIEVYGGGTTITANSPTIPENVWCLVDVNIATGGGVEIYLNGVLIKTGTLGTTWFANVYSSNCHWIGKSGIYSTTYSDGCIDEYMHQTSVRTPEDIRQWFAWATGKLD